MSRKVCLFRANSMRVPTNVALFQTAKNQSQREVLRAQACGDSHSERKRYHKNRRGPDDETWPEKGSSTSEHHQPSSSPPKRPKVDFHDEEPLTSNLEGPHASGKRQTLASGNRGKSDLAI